MVAVGVRQRSWRRQGGAIRQYDRSIYRPCKVAEGIPKERLCTRRVASKARRPVHTILQRISKGCIENQYLNKYLPESVVVKNGTNTTEFIYGNFDDWNNPLFKIEALYAGSIVERRNGTVVRDVKTKVTEIGQVYVVVPVPDSVQKAGGK